MFYTCRIFICWLSYLKIFSSIEVFMNIEYSTQERLAEIWRQKQIPVIFKKKGKGILVKLPEYPNDQMWLTVKRKKEPIQDKQHNCWILPVSRFSDIIDQVLRKYKKVYVIQQFSEKNKCARNCWNAEGHDCSCSCMGVNHGMGKPSGKWYEINDTFAFTYPNYNYACTLRILKD